MRYKNKVNKKDVIIQIAVIVVAVLFCIMSFWQFDIKSSKYFESSTKTQLEEVLNFNKNAIKTEIDSAIKTITLVSFVVTGTKDFYSEETIKQLSELKQGTPFSQLIISDTTGIAVSDSGEKTYISDGDYFYKAKAGRYGVSDLVINKTTFQNEVLVYAPVYGENKIIGVVVGSYNLDRIVSLFDQQSFQGSAYAYVVGADGRVLTATKSSDTPTTNNILTFLSDSQFKSGMTVDKLKALMDAKQSGIIEYSYLDVERVAYYSPLEINNWYIYQIIPRSVILDKIAIENNNAIYLACCLAIAFGAMIMCVVYYGRKYRRDIIKSNDELALTAEWLKISMSHFAHGIFEYDIDKNEIMNSMNCFETYGDALPPDQLVLDGYVAEKNKGQFLSLFAEIKRNEQVSEDIEINPDGKKGFVRITMKKVFADNGILVRAIGTVEDITSLKLAEEKYNDEATYRDAMKADLLAIVAINLDRDELSISYSKLDGIKITDVPLKYSTFAARIANSLVFSEDREQYKKEFSVPYLIGLFKRGITEVKLEYRRKTIEGTFRWIQSIGHILIDPLTKELKCFVYMKDITEQKDKEIALIRASTHDALTDLYNRSKAEEKIKQTLSSNNLTKSGVHGLFIIDIDNFKMANDCQGHACGDKVLIEVANVFRRNFRMSDIYGRLGGDEFIAMVKDADSDERIKQKADELRAAVSDLILPEYDNMKVSISIGVVIIRNYKYTYEELFKMADSALYKAKEKGKNQVAYYGEN